MPPPLGRPNTVEMYLMAGALSDDGVGSVADSSAGGEEVRATAAAAGAGAGAVTATPVVVVGVEECPDEGATEVVAVLPVVPVPVGVVVELVEETVAAATAAVV